MVPLGVFYELVTGNWYHCIGQSATTNLTVLTVVSYYELGEQNSIPLKHVTNKMPKVYLQLFKLPYNWFVSHLYVHVYCVYSVFVIRNTAGSKAGWFTVAGLLYSCIKSLRHVSKSVGAE